MDRAALGTNPTPRDWLNQSLKVEPGFSTTTTARRVICGGTGGGNTSAYFTSTTTTAAHFDGGESGGGGVGDYAAFSLPRLGNPHPHSAFPCHHHAFGPPPPPAPPPAPPPVVPPPPPLPHPAPSDCGGALTRAHAMHSLFESYTFESATTRQHTSVRMDHHILPPPQSSQHQSKAGGRCRKESVSSTEEGSGKATGEPEGSGAGSTCVVSRASYMCRKCKAHGQAVPVKRHKRACPYLQCRCLKCRLVDQGRKVVARQIALYRDQKSHSGCPGGGGSNGHSRLSRDDATRSRIQSLRSNTLLQLTLPRELRIDETRVLPSLVSPGAKVASPGLFGARTVEGPHCRRCRNHNVAVTWKGHKKACPYKNCPCDPCRLINVRKDTEKTLRDMAGIEEKSVLPTALLAEEAPTTTTPPTVGNFFPYLMPMNNGTQSGEMTEPSSANAESTSWSETVFPHRPPRRTRSLHDLNVQLPVSEAQMNENTTNQNEAIEHSRGAAMEGSRSEEASGSGSNNQGSSSANNNNTATTNSTASSTFEHYHRSSNCDVYYEDKTPRPVIPFWQSFSHFEEKSTVPGQGYIGGYYGLENGRVFHGNSQGHHMYSPERVSAVAAAAAAAAAMVAMTPPINGAYQQPCYTPQGRPGSLCHPLPSQHVDHLGYSPPDEFASPAAYQNRFPVERGRGDEYCGGGGVGGGGGAGNGGGWGAYRYPYVMRGIPFHPADPMEADFAFPTPQRHPKVGAVGMSKVVDEALYSRPVAHSWRSQLHQLSISQLRPEEGHEVKTFQQIECDNKIECPNEVKSDAGETDSTVQPASQALGINNSIDDSHRARAFSEEYASSERGQPPPPPPPPQQQQQTEVIFETGPGSASEGGATYRQFETSATGSSFAIDEAQPHPFPAVGTET